MSTGGQALGGIAGGVAGFFLSGGNPTGALYGAQFGMMLGGFLDPPKTPTINGPRLTDLTLQTSTYGAVIPRVYGTYAINGNVIWLENNQYQEILTKTRSSGKGGQSKPATRIATYFATFAIGLCAGPIIGVRRIWIGPDLFYDAGSTDPDTIAASNAAAVGFRVYVGSDTQAPDPRMQATLGVANTPAYRGLAYLVFEDFALAKYGNSLAGAQVKVEVFTAGSITMPFVVGSTPSIGGQWHCAVAFATWGGVAIGREGEAYTNYTEYLLSTDGGSTWLVRNFPFAAKWEYVAAYGNRVVVSGRDRLNAAWRRAATTTDGVTWTYADIPYATNGPITCNGSVWCIAGYGIAVISTDNCTSWIQYSIGVAQSMDVAIAHGSRLLLCNSAYDNYVTSDNNGVNWTARTFSLGGAGIDAMASNGSIIIAKTDSSSPNKIVSTDGGNTWSSPTTFVSGRNDWSEILWGGGIWVIFNAIDPGYIQENFAFSTDGNTWTNVAVGSLATNFWDGVAYTGSKFFCIWMNSGRETYTITPTVVPSTLQLSQIVSAECLQSGLLTANDIDVTELTSSVRGYVVGSVGAIRAALEPLQAAWPFDVRQHGYKVQFVARGGSSVVTIPAADLDARSGEAAPGVQITTRREMDSQLPRRVTINHVDPDREYNVCTQYAERLVTPAVNATVMDLSIVLTSTEAAGKAEVLLYLYWLERNDVTITLPATYLQLEPADVVTLVTPEGNISLRITDINYTSNALLEIKAKFANPAIYTPTAVGASPAVTGKTTIVAAGPAVYHLLDLPMISSHQTNPCFLVAMTGAQAGWRGGALMQSIDAGVSWVHVEDFDAPGATLGTASNALAAVDSRVIDAASVLSITLTQGTLSSVTQLGMFGGQNHFAYGAAGRWEIIAAQNCVLSSGQSYTLTGLLRGRFGTEWTMATHVNGDAIVLLDPIELARISVGSGTIGISYLYRGITVNRDISTDTDRAFAYQAVNLKPLSPIALTGAIDPATADWSLSWIRRTRDGGEWRDNVDAAIGELLEAYQIDVFADGSYAVIKRTMSSNTPAVTYLSADQVADFGANQTTLYLSIYQLSATVGRGYGLTTSITR